MSAMVSVVIPCYNSARWIEQTLESVYAQGQEGIEIIAVDDGSRDDTRELLNKHRDYIKLIVQENLGASAARNAGTVASTGRYIQYLDADDLLEPGTLVKRVTALERTGADVAYCDWQYYEADSTGQFSRGRVMARTLEEIDTDPEVALFTAFWSPPVAYLYRRTIVDRIGGWRESLPVIQDARFALDAAMQGGRFIHLDGVGALYRVHDSHSLSRRNPGEFILDCYRNACSVEEYWTVSGKTLTDARKKALADVYDYVARGLLVASPEKFRDCVRRIGRYRSRFRPGWPTVASFLGRIAGYRNAGRLLKLVGKPPIA